MIYRVLLCLLSVLLVSSAALADKPSPVVPTMPPSLSAEAPIGWDLLPGLSGKIALTAEQTGYLGEEATETGAMAYGRANRGAFYLTWVFGQSASPSPEETVRTAFDGLRESPFLASEEAGTAQEVVYRERSFKGVAEMNFEWAHMHNDTVNVVRALAWKNSEGRVHLAIGECVLHNESVGESRPLCEATLQSMHLTPSVTIEPLLSLAEPKAVGRVAPEDMTVPKLTTEDLPIDTLSAPPRQQGEVLYHGRPPAKPDNSNRALIGIGLVLLIAAVWLTTRSKPESREDDEKPEHDDDDTDS